jgi:hypothetical protein
MPRYYINFRKADLIANDDEGQDFPGFEEAIAAALISARELLADNIKSPATAPLEAVIITNEDGVELITILAKDILLEPLQ